MESEEHRLIRVQKEKVRLATLRAAKRAAKKAKQKKHRKKMAKLNLQKR